MEGKAWLDAGRLAENDPNQSACLWEWNKTVPYLYLRLHSRTHFLSVGEGDIILKWRCSYAFKPMAFSIVMAHTYKVMFTQTHSIFSSSAEETFITAGNDVHKQLLYPAMKLLSSPQTFLCHVLTSGALHVFSLGSSLMSLEPISIGLSERPWSPVPEGGIRVPSHKKREAVLTGRSPPNLAFEQVGCKFQHSTLKFTPLHSGYSGANNPAGQGSHWWRISACA